MLQEAATLQEGQLAAVADLLRGIALLGLQRVEEARAVLEHAERATADGDPVLQGRVALWRAIAWAADEAKLREGLRRADELLPPDWDERRLLAFWLARTSLRSDPEGALSLLDSIAVPHPAWLSDMAMTRALALGRLRRGGEGLAVVDALLADAGRLPADKRGWGPHGPGRAPAGRRSGGGGPRSAGRGGGPRRRRRPAGQSGPRIARAETLALQGDLPGAFGIYRALEEPEDPTNPLAWTAAAQARQLSGRPDAAEALDRAVALAPGMATLPIVRMTRAVAAALGGDALDALGQAYLSLDDPASALEAHTKAALGRAVLDRPPRRCSARPRPTGASVISSVRWRSAGKRPRSCPRSRGPG